MIQLVLYDHYGTQSSVEAVRLIHRMENENHPVVKLKKYNGIMMREVMIKAWLEFDTEEEAALFKLTHL